MYSKKAFKTLFLASAVVVEEKLRNSNQCKSSQCRPSDLPIYTPELSSPAPQTSDGAPSPLENVFKTVRQHYKKVYTEIKAYEQVGFDYWEQTKDNADWFLEYLREEDNVTPKAGAIIIGGLAGFVAGMRGGILKKTVYATSGALSMAALCYPQEASEYTQMALGEAKKYAIIAFNFVYGVKKDDPPLELPSLPKLPASLSDAWQSVTKSAYSLVSEPADDESEVGAKLKKDK